MIDYNYKVRNGQNKSWEDLEMIEFIISLLVPILGVACTMQRATACQ